MRVSGPTQDSTTINILIADDHAIVRDGLRALVHGQPGLFVVGEAGDGEEAWERARNLDPDVVVIDVSMPGLSGIEAIERITQDCPRVKVLALTMHEERGYLSRVLRAGAAGYALKRSASSELVRAIRAVVGGERYVDPSLAGVLLANFASRSSRGRDAEGVSSVGELTSREEEVLRLLALGHSNKEIAASLSISVKTVEAHRASGMARLGLTSRAALVRFALAEGWLQDA
jgi:DNA-binding NarL/FixJ family response regulator